MTLMTVNDISVIKIMSFLVLIKKIKPVNYFYHPKFFKICNKFSWINKYIR